MRCFVLHNHAAAAALSDPSPPEKKLYHDFDRALEPRGPPKRRGVQGPRRDDSRALLLVVVVAVRTTTRYRHYRQKPTQSVLVRQTTYDATRRDWTRLDSVADGGGGGGGRRGLAVVIGASITSPQA